MDKTPRAYDQYYVKPGRRKKSKVGKVIGFTFLALFILVVGYAGYWFFGIKSISDNFAMPSNPDDTAMESAYNDFISKASNGEISQVELDKEESKYFTNKLNSETSFFSFDDGNTAKIDGLALYPENGMMKAEIVVDIKSGLPLVSGGNPRPFFYAAASPNVVYGSLLGVSASLEIRDTVKGMAFKPLTVTVGSSPMPVNAAMALLRQFVPDVDITDDGFINFEPMEVFDNNGNKLFDITGFDIKGDNLIIYIN